MSVYRSVEVKKPVFQEQSEQVFWSRFKAVGGKQLHAKVTSVDIYGQKLLVTAGARLTLFDTRKGEKLRTFSRFKETALSGRFRRDGKLMVAGGTEGIVRVLDTSSRTVLRTFEGHSDQVHWTCFGESDTRIWSGSDDFQVCCWDLSSGSRVEVLQGHTDRVRCGAIIPGSSDLIVSGSYDSTVKVWDCRTRESVMEFKHSEQVESVVVLPGASLIACAAGNEITFWDLISGKAEPVHKIGNHLKQITGLALDGSKTRLFSCSIDQHVKAFDLRSYSMTLDLSYDSPVMSIAISQDNDAFAVGMLDGKVDIRARSVGELQEEAETSLFPFQKPSGEKRLRRGSYKYFERGIDTTPTAEDNIVSADPKRKRLQNHDALLRKFRFRDALDAAVKTSDVAVVCAVLEELCDQDALGAALGNRDDKSLVPFLFLVRKNISNPQFSAPLLQAMDKILLVINERNPVLAATTVNALEEVKKEILNEVSSQTALFSVLGSVDTLLNSALLV